MATRDPIQRAVHFGVGFVFGILVGFRLMMRYPYATGVTVAGVVLLGGMICGLVTLLVGGRS